MKQLAAAAIVFAALAVARADEPAAVYKSKCAACHGPDGKGQTPLGKNLKVKDLGTLKSSAAEIEKVIADGKPGTKMGAFKGKIAEADIKALAAFLKGGLK